MCSLTLSETTQEQLASLGGNGASLERLMAERAFSANVDTPGLYDQTNTNLRTGFADDLRQCGVRKETILRHRIFFVGNHTDCNYTAFFIKLNKRGDDRNADDNNPKFHEILRQALAGNTGRVIPDPQEIAEAEETEKEIPDWQNADWYKKYGGR